MVGMKSHLFALLTWASDYDLTSPSRELNIIKGSKKEILTRKNRLDEALD